jgi:hypothetical protein
MIHGDVLRNDAAGIYIRIFQRELITSHRFASPDRTSEELGREVCPNDGEIGLFCELSGVLDAFHKGCDDPVLT